MEKFTTRFFAAGAVGLTMWQTALQLFVIERETGYYVRMGLAVWGFYAAAILWGAALLWLVYRQKYQPAPARPAGGFENFAALLAGFGLLVAAICAAPTAFESLRDTSLQMTVRLLGAAQTVLAVPAAAALLWPVLRRRAGRPSALPLVVMVWCLGRVLCCFVSHPALSHQPGQLLELLAVMAAAIFFLQSGRAASGIEPAKSQPAAAASGLLAAALGMVWLLPALLVGLFAGGQRPDIFALPMAGVALYALAFGCRSLPAPQRENTPTP